MNVYTLIVFCAVVGVSKAPGPDDHHHHDSKHDCHDVPKEESIAVIQQCYSEHMCKEIDEHIDCNNVHLPPHLQNVPDPGMCGPGGITYASHCLFLKALCYRVLYYHHNNNNGQHFLSLSHEGPCVTTPPPTPQPIVTSTLATVNTSSPANLTSSPSNTTQSMTPTATASGSNSTTPTSASGSNSSAAVPTMVASTPMPSSHDMIQQLFCSNLQAFDCMASGINPVCGTDGQIYPNECKLQKAKCINTALRHTDYNNCSLNP